MQKILALIKCFGFFIIRNFLYICIKIIKSNKMKLLKFSADWCQPCKLQKKEFENNTLDTELVEIDIDDDNENLCGTYKIMSIPTMVLVNDKDEVINRWTGFTRCEVINNFIKKLK